MVPVRSLGLLAVFMFALAAADTIYKYVDEKGVTHYSNVPPAGVKPQEIEVEPAPAPAEAPGAKSWQEQEREFQQRQRQREAVELLDKIERAARARAEEEARQKCANAKARLAYLQRNRLGPAATRNEAGEIEYYNWEQRGREIDALSKFIDSGCR